jgi:hypothetical protein
MKTVSVLKLGIECRDKATGLKGTLTHWLMNMGGGIDYLFQPKGLDEEGQPLKRLYLCLERLSVKEGDFEMVEVPFEILGTHVTNKASGFTGMAVAFVRHINGCFHIDVQPQGTLPKKGTPIASHEFDLRGCVGDKIPKLSEAARKKSTQEEPSPAEVPARKSYGG